MGRTDAAGRSSSKLTSAGAVCVCAHVLYWCASVLMWLQQQNGWLKFTRPAEMTPRLKAAHKTHRLPHLPRWTLNTQPLGKSGTTSSSCRGHFIRYSIIKTIALVSSFIFALSDWLVNNTIMPLPALRYTLGWVMQLWAINPKSEKEPKRYKEEFLEEKLTDGGNMHKQATRK